MQHISWSLYDHNEDGFFIIKFLSCRQSKIKPKSPHRLLLLMALLLCHSPLLIPEILIGKTVVVLHLLEMSMWVSFGFCGFLPKH